MIQFFLPVQLQFPARANNNQMKALFETILSKRTHLKCFGQFCPESLRQEGGGDGAGEADQHHDQVRDLD